jgi:hypothetical protein
MKLYTEHRASLFLVVTKKQAENQIKTKDLQMRAITKEDFWILQQNVA